MRIAKLTVLVLGITLLATSSLAVVSLNEEPVDLLQGALDEYHKTIKNEVDPTEAFFTKSMGKTLKSTEFVCTQGKNPSDLTRKEYITEFAKGPCSPAVVLPGIGGSKLRVEIDCEKFKAANPVDFKQCGWKRCSGLQSPLKEYLIWIPTLLAPMSIFIDSQKKRDCFTAVFGMDDSQAIPSGKLLTKVGLTVKIDGTTPKTQAKTESTASSYFT
jgi:hypothetical protein